MDRSLQRALALASSLFVAVALTGCHPTQPYFLNEDGDLSHFLDKATEIEYPDVDRDPLPDAAQAMKPYSLINTEEDSEPWDASLEEVINIALHNSKVIRSIAQVRQTRQVGQGIAGPPESLSLNADFTPTVYDPAIEESGPNGVEAALSAFDAQWNTNLFWDRTDRPQNVNDATGGTQIFARILERDNMNFESELTKRSPVGTQWSFRNVSTYDASNQPLRVQASEWLTSFEAEARHPLMRGGGTQVNRVPVLLARIRTDQSLIQFSQAVRNHLIEIERAYWDLYFYYRNLETAKVARDSALGTWKRIDAIYQAKGPNVTADQEAQARGQYLFFRGQLEESKRDLLIAERQLRYLMGISPTDGRILRPTDDPTLAKVNFDWSEILTESLTRSSEIRQRQWAIKQRELELVAARNSLLPQVDVVALYRWLGLGDDLYKLERDGANYPDFGSLAADELTEGRFAEWRLGFEAQVPIGARAAKASVRTQQLALAREKARLEELELEISHALTDAVQRLDASFVLTKTAFLQRAASQQQVDVLEEKLRAGTVTVDLLLDAQRNRADAERAFFRSLIQYNYAILEVHYRKGSLLEYCGIALEEGPWPAKAYFDALIRARQRDASHYFNYGFSRPSVISRGAIAQTPEEVMFEEAAMDGGPMPTQLGPTPAVPNAEPLPVPFAEPMSPSPSSGNSGAVEMPNVPPAGAGVDASSAGMALKQELEMALGMPANQSGSGNTPAPTATPTRTAEKFDWGSLDQ